MHSVKKTYMVLLLVEKVIILAEYLEFANIFPKNLTEIFFKYNKANKYIIKLEKNT